MTRGERSLTVLIVDVSPVTWGHRELQRTASDKARMAKGKNSVGPATLQELLSAVQAFSSAYSSLERDSALVLIAVAGGEVAIVHPRKDDLDDFFSNPENIFDSRKIQKDLIEGVAELVFQSAARMKNDEDNQPISASLGAVASAFSTSLCLINRFLVASNAGISALSNNQSWNRGDDEGVIAALGGNDSDAGKGSSRNKSRAWSPRILIIQASDDRPADYNAFMNCCFASIKQNVVVDGCFIPSSSADQAQTSPYLEQTCDLTSGLWLVPKGGAQSNNALTEVLLSVFLPPRTSRNRLNLPAINKVDFRARAFDTGALLDMAFVCNQCLSIFKHNPISRCPTCDAVIRSTVSKNKKQRA